MFQTVAEPHVDAEESGHPVEVIGVVGHAQHFGHDGVLSPLGSKLLHQLHQVAGGCFTDGVDCGGMAAECKEHGLTVPSLLKVILCHFLPVNAAQGSAGCFQTVGGNSTTWRILKDMGPWTLSPARILTFLPDLMAYIEAATNHFCSQILLLLPVVLV